METLTGFKRAADLILTYHAKDAARWLKLAVELLVLICTEGRYLH